MHGWFRPRRTPALPDRPEVDAGIMPQECGREQAGKRRGNGGWSAKCGLGRPGTDSQTRRATAIDLCRKESGRQAATKDQWLETGKCGFIRQLGYHLPVEPDQQRAAPSQGVVVAGPVRRAVTGGRRLAHAPSLTDWIPAVNPPRADFCNNAPWPASPTTRSQRSTTCCHGDGTGSGQAGRLQDNDH